MNHQSKLPLFDILQTIFTNHPQTMWNSPIFTKVEILNSSYCLSIEKNQI